MMVAGSGQRNRKRKPTTQSSGPRAAGSRASAARAVAAARGTRKDRTRLIIGIIVVVVIAAAVVVGVIYQNNRKNEAAQAVIPARTVTANYPVTLDRSNATVLVGKPNAKVTLDAYEDFLCPICGDFESTNFADINKQLNAGTIDVRYHMVNLLDANSQPPGYSLMAANTALAVAAVAPDKFMSYHYSLYQKQPAEQGPGWTQAQLTSLANRLGISGTEFTNLVNGKTFEAQIQKNLTTAENDHSLWQQSSSGTGFGTPTIVADGRVINWQQAGWLDTLVKNGG